MPPKKEGPKEKALNKQQQLELEREQKSALEKEKQEAASWEVGAKSNAKSKLEEEKDAEKRRKEAEKAALIAADDAELSTVTRVVKTKKKGKDDFDFLDQALKNQPKSKADKDKELKKKADEERRKKEEEARLLKDQKKKVALRSGSAAQSIILYMYVHKHISTGLHRLLMYDPAYLLCRRKRSTSARTR